MKLDACSQMLWTTGDGLRSSQDPQVGSSGAAQLFDVHGLQGLTATNAGAAQQQPSYIDYDGVFGDPGKTGHMGDVAIWQNCLETEPTIIQSAAVEGLPPQYTSPGAPPPELPPEWIPPPQPFTTNLALAKTAVAEQCTISGAGSLCRFDIAITNSGERNFRGDLLISDTVQAPPGSLVGFSTGADWNCWRDAGSTYKCLRPNAVLAAGDSLILRSVVWIPNVPNQCFVQNTAEVQWAPSGSRWNTNPTDDIATATAFSPQPGCQQVPGPTNLNIAKSTTPDSCIRQNGEIVCRFSVAVSNVGPSLFSGDVQVYDEPTTASSVTFGNAPWACSSSGIGYDCTYPAALLFPGQQLNLWSWTRTPVAEAEAQACQISNQAFLTLPTGGTPSNEDPADDNAQALAVAPGGICVAVAAQQKTECPSGFKSDKDGCSPITIQPLPIISPPPVTVCPDGMRRVRRSQVLKLRRAGWDLIRQQSGQWCGLPGVEPPPPGDMCPHTMERVPATQVRQLRQQGWNISRVQGTNIWCGRPGTQPYPCYNNEYLERSWRGKENARSKGASVRGVRWNGKRGWCIGRIPSPERPICRGGTIAKIGNAWICRCPTYKPHRQTKQRDSRGREIIICLPIQQNCRPGEVRVTSLVRVGVLQSRGYQVRKVANKLWCARPPANICRSGERTVRTLNQVAVLRQRGYRIRKAGPRTWCALPPINVCRPGERTARNLVQVAALKAKGYRIRKAGKGTWCATPPVTVCRSGEQTIRNLIQVAALKSKGYRVRKAGPKTWCALPPVQLCRAGERTIRNRVQLVALKPRTISSRQVGKSTWCVRLRKACKVGWVYKGGRCQPIIRKCPKGTVGIYPKCIKKQCPKGTRGKFPFCKPIIRKCPKGTIGIYPKCIKKQCPPGTRGKFPFCKSTVKKCPFGYKGRPPHCKKIIQPPKIKCPRGTVGKWPKCRPVGGHPRPKKCPFGYKGRPPHCKKIIQPPKIKCPKGTVGKWPKCKKVGGRPRPAKCPFGYKGRPPNCKKIVKLPKIKCPKGTVGKWPKCKRVR